MLDKELTTDFKDQVQRINHSLWESSLWRSSYVSHSFFADSTKTIRDAFLSAFQD